MHHHPVGQTFDQRGSATGPCPVCGLFGRRPDGQDIVAVHLDPRHPVGNGLLGNGRRTGLPGNRGGNCPLVILADKDHRRLKDRPEVQPFMKIALRGGPVAEKGHHDIVFPTIFRGPAQADRMENLGTHRHRDRQVIMV